MNQTAVRYADAAAQELRRVQKKQDKPREEVQNGSRTYSHREMSDDEVLIPSTYRESTGWQTALNIGIGLLIGAAAIVFLYMPTKRAELNAQHNAEIRELNPKTCLRKQRDSGHRGEPQQRRGREKCPAGAG